jgi:hypothetical protein
LPPPTHEPVNLDTVRRWARLLDSAFRIPGTRLRFGLDPILGLIPGVGELTSPTFAAVLFVHALRLRVPKIVQLRMLLNIALDALAGTIPLVGDVVDLFWRANERNLALLELHAARPQPPRRGDWIFVGVVLGLAALCAVLPVVVLLWMLSQMRL